jgi:hypothetical protein
MGSISVGNSLGRPSLSIVTHQDLEASPPASVAIPPASVFNGPFGVFGNRRRGGDGGGCADRAGVPPQSCSVSPFSASLSARTLQHQQVGMPPSPHALRRPQYNHQLQSRHAQPQTLPFDTAVADQQQTVYQLQHQSGLPRQQLLQLQRQHPQVQHQQNFQLDEWQDRQTPMPPHATALHSTLFSQQEQKPAAQSQARVISGKDGTSSCSECGSSFKKASNAARHIASVHEKRKPFICEQCPSRFG